VGLATGTQPVAATFRTSPAKAHATDARVRAAVAAMCDRGLLPQGFVENLLDHRRPKAVTFAVGRRNRWFGGQRVITLTERTVSWMERARVGPVDLNGAQDPFLYLALKALGHEMAHAYFDVNASRADVVALRNAGVEEYKNKHLERGHQMPEAYDERLFAFHEAAAEVIGSHIAAYATAVLALTAVSAADYVGDRRAGIGTVVKLYNGGLSNADRGYCLINRVQVHTVEAISHSLRDSVYSAAFRGERKRGIHENPGLVDTANSIVKDYFEKDKDGNVLIDGVRP